MQQRFCKGLLGDLIHTHSWNWWIIHGVVGCGRLFLSMSGGLTIWSSQKFTGKISWQGFHAN